MPRSSRHKSSKHGSRDARDYSDSEKDSSSKDRKSKDESAAKVSKESGSGEKRKFDSKDSNGVYIEHSSKRRKERVDDGDDRWNGGDDDKGEGTKKVKDKLSESKSKRREENTGAYGESDEVVKKSSGKSEGKHRESSSRKEGREGGGERERNKEREREKENERYRRSKEGKSEKLIEVDDLRLVKQVSEKSELSARDSMQSPEKDSLPDRRIRKKRDDFDNGDNNYEEFGDKSDRRLSSREDATKNGRSKEEKHKGDRYGDKYHEDVERESRHRDDKQRDERVGKDHISNKSVDKISRDQRDSVGIRPKKPKPQDGDSAHERDHEHDRDHHIDAPRDNDHESYQRERDWDRERNREHDRDWERDRDRERERDRDRNFDYDVDGRSARYKDSRGRKRSPDDYDEYADTKSRGVKTACLDMEKRSMSSRVESDADRVKSQSSQARADDIGGSSRRRTSPATNSLGAADEYRHPKQEDLKYNDSGIEHRSSKSMSSRDVTAKSGASERNSKYRSNEKHSKMDEGGELSVERSSSSKASPMGLVDRSPSSTSLERRYSNRPGVRRTSDIEESGKRSNTPMGSRDFPAADDRSNRDLLSEKNLMDDSTSVDSSFYNRTSQNNSAPIPPPFRSRVGSPSFMGPQEEDGRFGAGSRYKRSGDHNMVRGQGNAWRGPPNWSSPLPNGYMPFQHGPHHGAFPAMLPQFPSLFGVRPSMEINHSGIPYHISDAERFASHMRPLGWQNMMDGSGPAHMWDGSSGVFRDESHLYGGPEWDQARHSMSGRGWEGNADVWKGQNGDMNSETPNMSSKEDFSAQPPVEELSVGQGGLRSTEEGLQGKATTTKTSVAPLENDSGKTSDKSTPEKTTDPKSLSNDNEQPYYAYLSQLDISTELVDPELYDQFATLLKIKQSETVEQDRSTLVNLKDGGKAVPKNSSTLLSSSLFPATSTSVFQRAMGIFKRQRSNFGGLPFADGRIVDAILESKETAPDNEPVPEEPVANHDDEMSEVNKEVETNANVAVPKASEIVPIKEAEVDAEMPDLKLESSDKPVMDSSISEMDIIATNKPVNSEDKEEMEVLPSLITEGGENIEIEDVICKTETLNSDGKCGALGSPESGREESESVILSRIHHSPESTH